PCVSESDHHALCAVPDSPTRVNVTGGPGSDAITLDLRPDGVFDRPPNAANNNPYNAVFGGDGDDTLTGSEVEDSLAGGAGNDVIDGRGGDCELSDYAGDDIVYGGVGDDVLQIMEGRDHAYGGPGLDWIFTKAQP